LPNHHACALAAACAPAKAPSRPARLATRIAAALGLALTSTHALAAGENITGTWDPTVYSWPLIPVHAVLTPDGRIMSYGTDGTGKQTGYFIYDVWDIAAGLNGGHLTLPNVTNTDIFCGSQLVLPQGGTIFLAGGDNWTGTGTTNTGNNNSNLFSLNGNTLDRGSNMNRARWYSASTALLNGEVMIQGGSGGTDRPEIRAVDGTFRVLTGADTSSLDFMYPRNFIAPDGRVFGFDSNGRMYYVNPAGAGSIALGAQLPAGNRGSDASAAMFRPGRILQFGGSSNGAVVIDITNGTPAVTATQAMSSQRRLVNAAILPDGRVLATGGSSVWNALTNVNNSAEVWNPTTGTWTRGPDGQRARLYHSISVLLPDARVLVGGGGAPGPQNNVNVEIYNPSYLFDASGARAVQPRLMSAPAEVNIGETFDVEFTDAADISRVTMVKTASVTHSFNMEQRFVELTFVRNGSQLRIQAPARAADAPPGFWMLFALSETGVPSVARIMKVNVAPVWNPAIAPTLANPGNRTSPVNVLTSLQLSATDPNGDELTYAASGLPTGLTLNTATGAIGGTPTASGAFNVVVSASDGINTAVQSFTWTIESNEIILHPPTPPAPVLAGDAATYTASSSGGVNPRYSWQFDDGTPDSPWSSSPSVTHTFTTPGIHYVTVWVTDDTGVTRVETIVQAVHLPLTANKPTASSNVTLESRATGNARLWVVNQDNDSVTVFDSVTRAKVKEITVGAAPRAVAVAPTGRIWVTNKQSGTISLIDPSSLNVVQTVTLPRASQPFGLAFAPTGSYAYVALEATGQLLKLNATSGATVASVSVGPNPRHLSVSADGARVYVSRFITRPLAGENTPLVQTGSGGGEVVLVTASSMAVNRTILLAHSDAPDFENQGRGVPNYLGAAVISPDGTQAWVPSKQDNIARGTARDGFNLNFQNTVRAISSRIALDTSSEDLGARIDHDNSSVASAVAYDPRGVYMFVALETSREVAVVDAHGQWEIFKFDVGRAPQGITLSANGLTLYVNNFMDRTVSVFNLTNLINKGATDVPLIGTMSAVATERLSAQVLKGKQLFYDARDPRLARDRYMSCASCHNDGGEDGRVWDITGMGEGLRNTISLRGRANAQGFLHWSGNFDEVQDFEGQIRTLAGGTGLMSDAAFNTGTRSHPLGLAKAGVSADLDALAAYVGSLSTFANSPYRSSSGTLTSQAVAGRLVFESSNCASCHGGMKFTTSGAATLFNIGTLKPSSGQRLGGVLSGIDPPTLRDVWATAPYLHDGSAATLANAVSAHSGVSLNATNMTNLVAYLQQIGAEESSGCPCSIWKPTDVPSSSTYRTTSGGIELGTRFRATTTGYIRAIRFYKHSGNNGTHVGNLWTSSGSLLARVTFSGETATGWQEMKLSTPIRVTANTWYVVSYHTRSGRYIGQANQFSSSGLANGPLYAARDGEGGSNGLYRNTSSSAFPNRTTGSRGYWVDVVYVNQ
jgi:YVTN family beta-propeller protein